MDEFLKRTIANKTLEWKDDNNLSFLWGSLAVFVYYDAHYNSYRILNNVGPEVTDEIDIWLSKVIDSRSIADEKEEN